MNQHKILPTQWHFNFSPFLEIVSREIGMGMIGFVKETTKRGTWQIPNFLLISYFKRQRIVDKIQTTNWFLKSWVLIFQLHCGWGGAPPCSCTTGWTFLAIPAPFTQFKDQRRSWHCVAFRLRGKEGKRRWKEAAAFVWTLIEKAL